jgi:hypothetical protein
LLELGYISDDFREQQKNEMDMEDGVTKDKMDSSHKMKQGRGGRAGNSRRKNSFDYFNAVQMLGRISWINLCVVFYSASNIIQYV